MDARYRGVPLIVMDVSSDPALGAAERTAWQKAGVCAAIVAPLAKGGRLVAEFGIHCAQARSWTAEEVALVQEVAERTWATAERARAEAALRASEEKYRSLFESMDEAYAVVEVLKDDAGDWVDFRFLDANPAFMDHTTMPYPVGKTATELLGAPNPRWTELYGKALDTGKPMRIEEPSTHSAASSTLTFSASTVEATVLRCSSPTSLSGGAPKLRCEKARRNIDRYLSRWTKDTA